MDLNGRMGYRLKPAESLQAQINYEDITQIQMKRKEGEGLSCGMDVYDDCMYGAIEAIMKEQEDCTVPWVRDNKKVMSPRFETN